MEVGRDYLKVALRLRRLVPGWVESYTGPPGLRDAVEAEEKLSVEELREMTERLAQRVQEEQVDGERSRWLSAQLRAIATALLWLGEERFDYGELFERCHGASVELVSDRQFERAHALLGRALPGAGDVAVRYRRWRDSQLIPPDRLLAGLELLSAEMRRRCRESFGLPDGERVVWQVVGGEPWAANADHRGHGETLIRVNADLPIGSPRLLELVCHEAYPGHHTEGACKDARLIQAAGREELSVYVYPSPQALLSEGLACCALEALLGDEAEQIAADCLRQAGIPYDPETAAAVREAETLLLPVRSNIAMMLHAGATAMDVRAYARTWLLDEPEQIDEAIGHLKARAWRPYESCYPVGLALCRSYTAGQPERFRELLNRQLIPEDLAREQRPGVVDDSDRVQALAPLERECLVRYLSLLAARLGDRLLEVRLFGSAARGDMWPAHSPMHSDVDLLVITEDEVDQAEQEALINETYPLFLESGRQLSPHFFARRRLAEPPDDRTREFLREIERDGARVWPNERQASSRSPTGRGCS
jgi:predicted nucleotidyltransferase